MIARNILPAELDNPVHQAAILHLIDMYAREPEGGGKPLPAPVRDNLIAGLKAHPTTLVFLAFVEDRPAGIAVCFLGFSTFAAKPLINIHDFAIAPEFRKQGISKDLLAAVEEKARALGCCKLTLEVLENNARAQGVYRAHGFDPGTPGERMGFYTKKL